jgi:hypothetical protein
VGEKQKWLTILKVIKNHERKKRNELKLDRLIMGTEGVNVEKRRH